MVLYTHRIVTKPIMLFQTLATLLLSVALTTAARLTISIPPSPPLVPNPATLPSSTHAVLLGPPGIRYDVPLRRDNTFIFPSLETASYLLSIHSRDHFFPPMRIDVTSQEGSSEQSISAWQTFRGNEWSNKGPHYGTGEGELSIEVRPMGEKQFYQERQGFSLVSFLRSPMILMALVSVLMIFGLPYLMDNSAFSRNPC
jgi:ER membrane protein complex subunit 7